MSTPELAGHLRRKLSQLVDARRESDWRSISLATNDSFPRLPQPNTASPELRQSIVRAASEILAGRWKAFGHLPIEVDDPPRWHKDYVVSVELSTDKPAFKLSHRSLPNGADIQAIWDLSRWRQLVNLAQAAWLLDDDAAGRKCLAWLDDWNQRNPPYRGWNWISALEAGIRLVQFTWIDRLLSGSSASHASGLERLRYELLPAHVRFVWKNRSFGSSANNHLLGELAGLIIATARWPALASWGAPLHLLRDYFQREVLSQFASDGGNREQALNYHLFALEFCCQTRAALASAGLDLSSDVIERLHRAAAFYASVQAESDIWDYGDSDNAYVTPLCIDQDQFPLEWRCWLRRSEGQSGLTFWLGKWEGPAHDDGKEEAWRIFSDSGLTIRRKAGWMLRYDVSPLGYLRTAAHGHLDALHLSIWRQGVAIVIDPGTELYYLDKRLRNYLTSWEAHNGPHFRGADWPRRLGPFLWSDHHPAPRFDSTKDRIAASLSLQAGEVSRAILELESGWEIIDTCPGGDSRNELEVHWQFAPHTKIEQLNARTFRVSRSGVVLNVSVGDEWTNVALNDQPATGQNPARHPYGICSQKFRIRENGPWLLLVAPALSGRRYSTRFEVSS